MSKKTKPSPKFPIVIPKRTAGKVTPTDYMKNLRPFPSPHPVEELLGISPEIQSDPPDFSEDLNLTNMVDQTNKNLDDQQSANWSTDNNKIGRPNQEKLVDQPPEVGRPTDESLVDKTTKNEIWSTKESGFLVDQTTKEKNLVDQKNQNPTGWVKYERARSTARIGLRPNADILRKIKVFCAENDLDVTEFFEIAGMKFIDLVDQTKESLVVWSPLDDRRLMITWKTKYTIINLYLAYNANFGGKSKWSAKDDDVASKFNDVDIRIIELGLIQTQANKNYTGRINSFSYYAPEIQNFIELNMQSESLELMLEINRKRWTHSTGKIISENKAN